MDSYTIRMMVSFQDELEKRALSLPPALGRVGAFLKQQAGATGAGAGVGALGGGLVGAGVQGVRGYQRAKDEGASTGQALLSGATQGLSGASTGAMVGAGIGGAAGLAGGARARGLAERAVGGGTWNPLAASARFGQRQLHSVTGYANAKTPEGLKQLRAMRGGAYQAQERADAARKALDQARWSGASNAALQGAHKELNMATQGLQAAEKAEAMGLTSVPGYLRSLASNPVDTIRTGVAEQWRGSGLGGKLLFAGFPVAGAVGEAMSPSEEGGPGRLERTGKALAGGLAFGAAPIPMVGMGLLSSGAEQVGGLLGAGGDALLRHRAGGGQ